MPSAGNRRRMACPRHPGDRSRDPVAKGAKEQQAHADTRRAPRQPHPVRHQSHNDQEHTVQDSSKMRSQNAAWVGGDTGRHRQHQPREQAQQEKQRAPPSQAFHRSGVYRRRIARRKSETQRARIMSAIACGVSRISFCVNHLRRAPFGTTVVLLAVYRLLRVRIA